MLGRQERIQDSNTSLTTSTLRLVHSQNKAANDTLEYSVLGLFGTLFNTAFSTTQVGLESNCRAK